MVQKKTNVGALCTKLIAPCGINCNLCRVHLRKHNPCPGCRVDDPEKLPSRTRCKIKTCIVRTQTNHQFCLSSKDCPCTDLLRLDKRYRLKYGFSPIANVQRLKKTRIKKFIVQEKVDKSLSF